MRRPAACAASSTFCTSASLSIEWTTSKRPAFLALFDCRWPIRCQRIARSVGLLHLEQRLLDLVLAEIDLSGVGGGAHVLGGEGLGDGDEADGGGIAPGPAGRPRDARANVCQPGTERSGVDHYFFNVPRIPFAVAAFGPVGASFR